MTNYEKIKNMSVEEMAELMRRRGDIDNEIDLICETFYDANKCYKKDACKKCFIKWLESESKEELE